MQPRYLTHFPPPFPVVLFYIHFCVHVMQIVQACPLDTVCTCSARAFSLCISVTTLVGLWWGVLLEIWGVKKKPSLGDSNQWLRWLIPVSVDLHRWLCWLLPVAWLAHNGGFVDLYLWLGWLTLVTLLTTLVALLTPTSGLVGPHRWLCWLVPVTWLTHTCGFVDLYQWLEH